MLEIDLLADSQNVSYWLDIVQDAKLSDEGLTMLTVLFHFGDSIGLTETYLNRDCRKLPEWLPVCWCLSWGHRQLTPRLSRRLVVAQLHWTAG